MQKQSNRHVPVRGSQGIYKSQRADGSWAFEVRRYVYDRERGTKKRTYEVVGTRLDEAKARAAEITRGEFRGERVSSASFTVSQAISAWRETKAPKLKPRTRESYERIIRKRILPRWGSTRVRDVSSLDVEGWLVSLSRQDGKDAPLSDGSKKLVLAVFSLVLARAVKAGAISVNPVQGIERDDKPKQTKLADRILSLDEEDRLLASCGNFRWLEGLIETALLGALRMGEVLALRWRDVDFDNGRLHVRESYGKNGQFGLPKGGLSIWIDLHPRLRKMLVELKLAAAASGEDDLVFPNLVGGPRNPRDVQRAFSKARRYAKLSTDPRALRFHDLRHTAISRLANGPSVNIKWVQSFARHANLETTLGYVHEIRDEEAVQRNLAALSGERG